LNQIIEVYSLDDDNEYRNEMLSVAYDNINKKAWEETKVTSELLDIKVDLMLLLRKEKFLLKRLAERMKVREDFLNTESDKADLLALTDLLVHEDTLFFDLRGRDFEYQEKIYSDEVIKMLYNPPYGKRRQTLLLSSN